MQHPLPKLITFDGEARSGKGTVVGQVKDYLRDECGRKVMLIDTGQVFRVLVVAITGAGVDIDSPEAIDAYLADESRANEAVQLVKAVYRMSKDERNALLYTSEVNVNCAKVGARPLGQAFKDGLICKWLNDARVEGFDTVLVDGRAMEETGEMLESKGLCSYLLGFFFVCDPVVSAQRTLGRMPIPYEQLDKETRQVVDELVAQIEARNTSDRERTVQPLQVPENAPRYAINEIPGSLPARSPRPMAIIDRSIEVPLDTMALPIARLVAHYVQ